MMVASSIIFLVQFSAICFLLILQILCFCSELTIMEPCHAPNWRPDLWCSFYLHRYIICRPVHIRLSVMKRRYYYVHRSVWNVVGARTRIITRKGASHPTHLCAFKWTLCYRLVHLVVQLCLEEKKVVGLKIQIHDFRTFLNPRINVCSKIVQHCTFCCNFAFIAFLLVNKYLSLSLLSRWSAHNPLYIVRNVITINHRWLPLITWP